MNWDAIGVIAEQLGAVGVIASLVYLARQMAKRSPRVCSIHWMFYPLSKMIII